MKNLLLRQFLEPMLTRLGTLTAGALVGVGMASQDAPTVAQAIVVVGLVGFDLAVRQFTKAKV